MLPPAATAWLSAQRGEPRHVDALASTQGRVWAVHFAAEESVVVKTGSAASIDREVWGLGVARVGTPSVLARLSKTEVVLSWHEGEPVASDASVRAAGAWLAELHATAYADGDPMDVGEALARRRDAWLGRAAADLECSRVAAFDFEAFAGTRRVVCHRDFTPINWRWDSGRGLTVIDFGQSRPDVALWDLVKLEAVLFHQQPSLRAAFYAGYGTLGPDDEARLAGLMLLHGLQTAVWGDLHGDAEFSALGRAVLSRET